METELACGKCEKPICPRCLHYTPVGVRCRECANIRRLPTYQISLGYLLRGAGAALGSGAALGALWGLFLAYSLSILLGLLVGLGLGYAVGEAVSVATNRKSGPPLQVAAAVGVVVAYVVRSAMLAARLEPAGFLDVVSNDTIGYVVAIVAVVVALGRVR